MRTPKGGNLKQGDRQGDGKLEELTHFGERVEDAAQATKEKGLGEIGMGKGGGRGGKRCGVGGGKEGVSVGN